MHSKKIINNSMIGVAYRVLMMLLGFVTRKIFIVYLGEEILGLNSLYANLLDLLNLADLGIGVAAQYQLYGPLVRKDNEKLSKIISATKRIYDLIGLFILVAGLILSFFIQYTMKATSYPLWFIRISFLISVAGIALGYFFVHERLFLQANEEIGLVNMIDLAAKVLTVVLSLITTIVWKNYFLYLLLNALYGLVGNIAIHFIFRKKYPDIGENVKDIGLEIRELTRDLKNVVPMKLSNYVYNSTDNVVISKVLGLTTVALYSNYMTIINGIMGIEYLIGNVINASFGKIIKENSDKRTVFQYYMVFQYAQFLFTGFATVALAVLCEPFIKLWIGEQFLVTTGVFALLIVDFYVHSMYQPAYVMFGATGKFQDDKWITSASAVMNICISVGMVMVMGLPGVILGTLITDLYIWFVRVYQMVKKYFDEDLFKYAVKMAQYTVSVLIGFAVTWFICSRVSVNSLIAELFIKLMLCVLIPNAINLAVTCMSEEFRNVKRYLLARWIKGEEQ